MAAPEGRQQAWSPEKYEQLLSAAAAKKKLLLRSFRKEEGLRPSGEQAAYAKKAIEKIEEAERLVRLQVRFYLAEEKEIPADAERAVHRLSIALYILHTLRQVHAKAVEKGDSAAYNLFISAASEASRLIRTDYMLTDYERMVSEFTQVQGKLDACAEALGTKSYDITEAVEHFKFPLARMQQEMQREIAAAKNEERMRDLESLPEWGGEAVAPDSQPVYKPPAQTIRAMGEEGSAKKSARRPEEVGAEEFFSRLEYFAPLSGKLRSLLSPPEKLYMRGNRDNPSFSSEQGASIGPASLSLIFNRHIPEGIARYGLEIIPRGSSAVCTFVDSERKIAVQAAIGGLYSEYSWERFEECLEAAISNAERGIGKKIDFRYLRSKEGAMSKEL